MFLSLDKNYVLDFLEKDEGDFVYVTSPASYVTIGNIKNNEMSIHADYDDRYGFVGKCEVIK